MSVAYYIVLNGDADFDTYVSGKSLAKSADELNRFCVANKIRPVEFYLHQDYSEFLNANTSPADENNLSNTLLDEAMLSVGFEQHNSLNTNPIVDEIDPLENDDNIDDAPEQEQVWFEPEKGIEWVDRLVSTLQIQSPHFLGTELISDLLEYQYVFRKAAQFGLLWHLEVEL